MRVERGGTGPQLGNYDRDHGRIKRNSWTSWSPTPNAIRATTPLAGDVMVRLLTLLAALVYGNFYPSFTLGAVFENAHLVFSCWGCAVECIYQCTWDMTISFRFNAELQSTALARSYTIPVFYKRKTIWQTSLGEIFPLSNADFYCGNLKRELPQVCLIFLCFMFAFRLIRTILPLPHPRKDSSSKTKSKQTIYLGKSKNVLMKIFFY